MKQIIIHRCNTIDQIKSVPHKYGVEIDIRTYKNQLILHHDPFSDNGEKLEDWLIHFKHNSLILNVKEEGLEERLIQIIKDTFEEESERRENLLRMYHYFKDRMMFAPASVVI